MLVVYLLDMFGVAVFAVAGALAAGRKRMDLFGVLVLGLVTALGGGTLRDLVLDAHPVFWIADPAYLAMATAAAGATFVGARRRRPPGRALLVADALGLAVFTAIGAAKTLSLGFSGVIAVIMGMFTGVAGGMLRDVLAGEIPLIFRREIYATASLAGGAALALLQAGGVPGQWALAGGAAVTLGLRLAAIRWGLSLPVFLFTGQGPPGPTAGPDE
jgi:uncharacterized membrane protein YeiH